MPDGPTLRRVPIRLSWLVALSLPVACGIGGGGETEELRRGFEGVPLPILVHLEPGAEVGKGVPIGWTHRVVRSVPSLASGDLETLPGSAEETATRFRTVITAEVVGQGTRAEPYRLARVGVGNAVPVDGRELVVSTTGPREVMEVLGVVDRVVLLTAESTLKRGILASRSPTFALFRTPTVLVVDGEHREVDLHYAILVDPRTGSLSTLCWPRPEGDSKAPESLVRLAPGLSFDAKLDVRVTRRIGPAAVAWSFALIGPPPGPRIRMSASEASLLTEPAPPKQLGSLLRRLAETASPSTSPSS